MVRRSSSHVSGRMPMNFKWLDRLGKIPWSSGQKNIKWAGSFYNWITRGNSAGTDWFRLPSLYKWSSLDILVIGCFSECRDLNWVIVPVVLQVSGYRRRWMSFLSLWVSRTSGPVLQTNTTLSTEDWIGQPYTYTWCSHTTKRKYNIV